MSGADGVGVVREEIPVPVAPRRGAWGWIEEHPRRAGWIVAAVALGLRLLYVLQISKTPYYHPDRLDPLFYFNWASDIAAGNWIGDKIFVQSPLYAYVVAVILKMFGGRIFPLLLCQVLAGVGTCLLTIRITRRVLGEREAFVAGLLAALYGPFLFYEGMVMKTFLSTFLTVLLVDLLQRSEGARVKLLVISGLVFALTSLVRDNFVLLFPLLMAGFFFVFSGVSLRGRMKACALFTLGAAAGILPVTIRNYAVGHEFALLTTGGGEVFYIGNNPDANGRYLPPAFVHADPMREHDDFIAKAGELSGRKLTPGESSNFWIRQGLSWIAENPGAWGRLLLKKLLIFWNWYELPDNYNYLEVRQILLHPMGLPGALLFVPLQMVTFGLIAPLGLTGILLTRRRWRDLVLVYVVLFGYMGTVLLFFNFSRFRVPVVPFLCLFAGATVVALLREAASWLAYLLERPSEGAARTPPPWDRIRRRPALAVFAVCLLAAFWLVHTAAGTGGRGAWPALQGRLRMGDTYRATERFEDAEKEYRLGLQILGDEPMDPRTAAGLGADPERLRKEVEAERVAQGVNFVSVRAGLHFGLGAVRIEQGKKTLEKDRGLAEDLIRRGIGEVEMAAKSVPFPPYLARLAEGYTLLGKMEEAEKAYRGALMLAETDFGIRYDLAGLFYETGRFPQALEELQAGKKLKPQLSARERADFHFGMGLVRLDGFRERGRALYHFQQALEANPDHREAKRMRELIRELEGSGVRPEKEE